MWGEKGVDLGRDLGPLTVQLSFNPETAPLPDASISRYADPEAEGVTPVLRSSNISFGTPLTGILGEGHRNVHSLRMEFAGLDLEISDFDS